MERLWQVVRIFVPAPTPVGRRYAVRRRSKVVLVWEIDLGARPTTPVSASALSSLNPGTCFVSAVAGSPPRWMKRLAPICDSSCGPSAAHPPPTYVCTVPPPRRTAAHHSPARRPTTMYVTLFTSRPPTLSLWWTDDPSRARTRRLTSARGCKSWKQSCFYFNRNSLRELKSRGLEKNRPLLCMYLRLLRYRGRIVDGQDGDSSGARCAMRARCDAMRLRLRCHNLHGARMRVSSTSSPTLRVKTAAYSSEGLL
ncbi:hypothetical protein B0T26DRAFT_721628, partial [Lasiosphaeria miniovina]